MNQHAKDEANRASKAAKKAKHIRNKAVRYKFKLYAFYNAKCYICNKYLLYRKATIDHIVCIKDGGTNHWDNLALCCNKCNNKKDAEESANKEINDE